MADDQKTYASGLCEWVDKKINQWSKQKKVFLESKFQRNYEAVTNQDFRSKSWKKDEAKDWRSDTWIGFIRVKLWTLYSIFVDTVMQGGGQIPFDLKPDPYEPEENLSEEYIEDRDDRIDRMKKRIKGQLKARKADREYMLKWLSSGYYGMAFSKFDVDEVIRREFREVDMGLGDTSEYLSPEESAEYVRYERVMESEDVPGHRYVSVWNMFWDMEASNLQDGEGYAEKIPTSVADLRKLKDKPGYINDAIDKVIDENRSKREGDSDDSAEMTPGMREIRHRNKKLVRYEYYAAGPRKLVDEFEKQMKGRHKYDTISLGRIEDYAEAEESGDVVEIMGEICEKEIIRHIRNETGKRNHHMFFMEIMLDDSYANGVADNMEGVQSSLVGMIRAFEDNKKLSANVTAAVKERFFMNPSQLDSIVPGKTYKITETCPDVRQAIMPIVFPDVGESLVSGIGLMERWKDDVSMIPTILQGFNLPKHKPDTAFEVSQMMENSGKYIGMIVRNNDEMFIEPEVTDIYEYNMLYDPDQSIKVPAKVSAEGFTGFRNKVIRGEAIKAILGMVLSSEVLLGQVKIAPHLTPIYESVGLDPDDFLKSEEELAEDQRMQEEMIAEEEAKAKEALAFQTQLETESKIAIEETKTEGKIREKMVEGEIDSQENEDEFQRDVLKGLIDERNQET